MFYFGYIAWEYPTTRLLQFLPLGKYSAFNIIMWVRNYHLLERPDGILTYPRDSC